MGLDLALVLRPSPGTPAPRFLTPRTQAQPREQLGVRRHAAGDLSTERPSRHNCARPPKAVPREAVFLQSLNPPHALSQLAGVILFASAFLLFPGPDLFQMTRFLTGHVSPQILP